MMSKRKPLIFFTLVFAILALFAVSEVMAFCDYCDPPLVGPIDNQGWFVELESIVPCDGALPYDPPCSGAGLFEWLYNVYKLDKNNEPTASGLNFLAMLIPDCCVGPKITVDKSQSTGFNDYFPVAEGEPTLCFGCYNEQTRVAEGTPDNSTQWRLIASTDQSTESTILLKARKVGVLTYEMAVPGCAATAGGGVTFTSCVNWYGDPENTSDDISLQVTRMGDTEGCIVPPVEFYVGIGCDPDAPRQEISGEQLAQAIESYVSSGSLSGQVCDNEVMNVSHSSPWYLYEVVSGGYVFRSCLNLNVENPAAGPYWENSLAPCGL
jgi:hypothetical protein